MWRHARSAAASISSRSSSLSAGDGDSSMSFWWRRWIEHSRSPHVRTVPWWSHSTWISTWRAGDAHLGLRARLVAHALHHLCARTDEDQIVLLARADEVGVLGEEPVAGM